MIDYSKPGKTPPGTKHLRPPRKEKLTWHDLVAPHPDHIPPGDRPEHLDGTVTFTWPTTPPNLGTSRRERREAARAASDDPSPCFESIEVPVDEMILARKRRRLDAAHRSRRQRKGQRRFLEAQRQRAFTDDTVRAQLHVLEVREPGDPLYDNVLRSLVAKYGDQLEAMAAAQ